MRDDIDEELRDIMKEMMLEIRDMKEKNEEHHRDVHERMTNMEHWKWYVIGAASVTGTLFSFAVQYMGG